MRKAAFRDRMVGENPKSKRMKQSVSLGENPNAAKFRRVRPLLRYGPVGDLLRRALRGALELRWYHEIIFVRSIEICLRAFLFERGKI